mgnify:CR=1 FL=1
MDSGASKTRFRAGSSAKMVCRAPASLGVPALPRSATARGRTQHAPCPEHFPAPYLHAIPVAPPGTAQHNSRLFHMPMQKAPNQCHIRTHSTTTLTTRLLHLTRSTPSKPTQAQQHCTALHSTLNPPTHTHHPTSHNPCFGGRVPALTGGCGGQPPGLPRGTAKRTNRTCLTHPPCPCQTHTQKEEATTAS